MGALERDTPHYRIGAVSKLTGVSTHQLRIWERRYGTVQPLRSAGGDRLYTEGDIERLKMLKRLNDAGHAIGSIARLSQADLERLLARHRVTTTPPSTVETGELARTISARFIDAIFRMDISEAERALSRGSVAFEPRDFAIRVLIPALRQIGALWESGDFSVAHEHAASAAIRTQLGMLVRLYSNDPSARGVVCATPAGELHEFGAMSAALASAASGWRVIYLGPNLPAEHIVQAVEIAKAELLLLSVIVCGPGTSSELARVAAALPVGVGVVVGGEGVRGLRDVPARIRVVSALEQLPAYL